MFNRYKRKHGRTGDKTYSKALAFFAVDETVTEDEIKSAYRDFVKSNHPDVSNLSSGDVASKMQTAKEMRDVILTKIGTTTDTSAPCVKCNGAGRIRLPGFNGYVKCRRCEGQIYDETV